MTPMSSSAARPRVRMTGAQRRQQLLDIGRELFGRRGFEATSIEEIAARADVSKPVVYEHFGGKEGLYAVVVDREMQALLDRFTSALSAPGHPREMLERAALVLLDYIEEETDGFRVLTRDAPVTSGVGGFSSLIGEVARKVEHILGRAVRARGYDPRLAELYSQALVGMVALVGQWWLDTRSPGKHEVAAHLVNLAYNGLAHLDPHPGPDRRSRARRDRGLNPPVLADQARARHGPVHGPHGAEDAGPGQGGGQPDGALLVGGQRRHRRPRAAHQRPGRAGIGRRGQCAAQLGTQRQRGRLQVVGQRRGQSGGRAAAQRGDHRFDRSQVGAVGNTTGGPQPVQLGIDRRRREPLPRDPEHPVRPGAGQDRRELLARGPNQGQRRPAG